MTSRMPRSTLLAVALLALGCRSESPPRANAMGPRKAPLAQGASPSPLASAPMAAATAPPSDVAGAASPGTAREADGATTLEAERERRIRAARTELGGGAAAAVVEDVFVVVGAPDWQGAAFERSVALVRDAMRAFRNGRFSKSPKRAISIYLFATAGAYEGFCKQKYGAPCIAHYGFYSPDDRYMVMNAGLGLGTLTHELVHPLVEADFPEAPTWLNEGIASVFEAPVIPRPGEIHGTKNWRHPRLKRALTTRERARVRLDVLFGMSNETFRGDHEDLNYALARYVCQWLDERGKLWPFFQRYRDTFSSDPTGEAAFREVLGTTPSEAHARWERWVLSL